MVTKKNDFVELIYTGYSNGNIFDSNIPEDLKKLSSEAKPPKLIVVIGQAMVVPGLDKALEGKEINTEYEIKMTPKEGFGERDRNMMKTIPLRIFTEKQIMPKPGMVLNLDNMIAKIISVSGARVITDFNNPLAGKDISYKYKIIRILTDEKEKASALFEQVFKFVPEFDINDKEIIIKGQKSLEVFVTAFKDKVKEIMDKNLVFQEKKKDDLESITENKAEKKEDKQDSQN